MSSDDTGQGLPRGHAYAVAPLAVVDGIPVFSEADRYMENYARISEDHLAVYEQRGENPFMQEDFWVEAESTTRALIQKWAPPGCRILDVGVGLGRLLEPLTELERFGMDISLGYLQHARDKGIEVCLAKVEDMPYATSFFDVVVCTDVLEHVLDLNAAVANMLRVLKPGGTMIVRVPYKEWLGLYLQPDYPYEYAHVRNFDEFSLTLFFEKIMGCEVLEWTPGGHALVYELFKYRVPKITFTLVDMVKATRRVSERLYDRLVRKLFFPVDVNFVVRKPTVPEAGDARA